MYNILAPAPPRLWMVSRSQYIMYKSANELHLFKYKGCAERWSRQIFGRRVGFKIGPRLSGNLD